MFWRSAYFIEGRIFLFYLYHFPLLAAFFAIWQRTMGLVPPDTGYVILYLLSPIIALGDLLLEYGPRPLRTWIKGPQKRAKNAPVSQRR